jgi:tetratricopeptide (TPR) repeat protein
VSEQPESIEQRSETRKSFLGRPLRFVWGVLIVSALYLFFPARQAMNAGAAIAIGMHLAAGVLAVVPTLFYLKRARNGGRWLFGLAVGVTGFYLLIKAALGHSTARDTGIWWLHVGAGLLIAAWIVGAGLLRIRPKVKSQTAALASVMLLGLLGVGFAAGMGEYPAEAYYRDLTATNARQADNPLFPAGTRFASASGTQTESATRWKTQSPEYCGRSGCHANQFHGWLHSAHSSAESDPIYAAVRSEFEERKGKDAARFCAGCHAPQTAVSPAAPSSGQGVDCLACHAATHAETSGNGRLTYAVRETYPFAQTTMGLPRRLHEFLLRVRPAPHQAALSRPALHSQPELCAGCHRQSFSVAQNGYQFVRTVDTWGEWQSGAVSGRAARTPALSAQPTQTCQQCHFPRHNGDTSHNSPGANLPLAALNNDGEHRAHLERFLQDRLAIDIFALRRAQTQPGKPDDWIAPLDKPLDATMLRSGDRVTLEIVVSNRRLGHAFPTGYSDLRDAWLEITLTDAAGKTLSRNAEHRYTAIPLDKNGNALTRHELDKQVTVAYQHRIPAGGSEVVRYALTLPKTPQNSLRIHARLMYRHLRPDFVRWAIPQSAPENPAMTLAQSKTQIRLNAPLPAASPQNAERRSLALRFAEYGNGLLLPAERPDLSNAQRAFAIAQSLSPDFFEAYLGMGRVYLREPLLLNARAQFELALKLKPGHPAATAELGTVFLRQAEYAEAIRLLKPLTKHFGQDTALWFDLGTAYFRSGQFEDAAQSFRQALAADPDNSAAHFQLMRAYQRLRRGADTRREEAINAYLTPDPLNASRRNTFLSRHPNAFRAAQPIPIYEMNSVQ